jgi:hypothetical protein
MVPPPAFGQEDPWKCEICGCQLGEYSNGGEGYYKPSWNHGSKWWRWRDSNDIKHYWCEECVDRYYKMYPSSGDDNQPYKRQRNWW